jgi:predicted RNA-binding Zn-ribbon protein involved in translation (DUF1610 family)
MPKCRFAALTNPDDWVNETSRTVAVALGIGKSSVNDHRSGACVCYRRRAPKIHEKASNVRVLTLDLESKPLVSAHWDLWGQNISTAQIIKHGGLLCFAASWYGSDEVMFFSEWEHGQDVMVQKAWELLNECNILVTYNGVRYDAKRLNNEFLKAGLNPPMPYKHVDLYKVNKKQFQLPSRRLDYIAQQTLGDGKTPHTGFQLWMDVMNGDKAAQALMEEYNIQDVRLTEALFDRLRPWLTGVPHIGAIAGVHGSCPHCGSTKLKREGNAHANVAVYKAYRCESCGSPVRSTTRLQDTTGTRAYAA